MITIGKGPLTDSTRKITEYAITDTTKIIHYKALPDKGRQPYPPWEEDRNSNSLSKLWYEYKDEMLEDIDE